jgi:hypothetical protein
MWEYKVVDLPHDYNGKHQVLNELGEQGWEMIAI